MEIDLEVDQFLILTQTITTNPKYLFLNQNLTFNQNQHTQRKYLQVNQTLNLAGNIKFNQVRNLIINQRFSPSEKPAKIAAQPLLTQTFHPWQQIFISPTGIINHNLNLNESFLGVNTKGIIQTLNINQSIIFNFKRELTVTQTLNINQGTMGRLDEICDSSNLYSLDGPNSSGGDIN